MRITWRDAIWSDRSLLPSFTCTEPVRKIGYKKTHPAEWELDVQSVIRSRTPPFQPPLFMVVGETDGGAIAAAGIYSELDGPRYVELEFMAVARDWRRRGGDVADALFQEIFRRLEERAIQLQVGRIQVTSCISPHNVASQQMAMRAQLGLTRIYDTGVQEWTIGFDVANLGDELPI